MMVTTHTGPVQTQTKPNPSSEKRHGHANKGGCWKRESLFSLSAAPDRLPVLQWKTTQPRTDGQHQWDLMSLEKEREHEVGWVVRRTKILLLKKNTEGNIQTKYLHALCRYVTFFTAILSVDTHKTFRCVHDCVFPLLFKNFLLDRR